MSKVALYSHWRFWCWMAAAFFLGIVAGFVLCLAVGIILTATISYAQ